MTVNLKKLRLGLKILILIISAMGMYLAVKIDNLALYFITLLNTVYHFTEVTQGLDKKINKKVEEVITNVR